MEDLAKVIEDINGSNLDDARKKQLIMFLEHDLERFREEVSCLMKTDTTEGLLNVSILDKLEQINWNLVLKAEEVTAGLDRKLLKILTGYFRCRAGELFFSSVMLDKGFKKERGYPGDFEMMNYVYDNVPKSVTRMGQYFDRAFLDNGYACAVRGRKNKIVEILRREVASVGTSCRILNLPCGPARDIKELLENFPKVGANTEIVCVDQDEEALAFARASMPKDVSGVSVQLVQGNILGYIKSPDKHAAELGQFDVVYSIGIADYLPDMIMEKMLKFAYSLLKKNGRLYFAYKIHDKDIKAPLQPKWYCSWDFVPRNVPDALNNFKAMDIPAEKVSIEWEETGRIAFLKVVKEC